MNNATREKWNKDIAGYNEYITSKDAYLVSSKNYDDLENRLINTGKLVCVSVRCPLCSKILTGITASNHVVYDTHIFIGGKNHKTCNVKFQEDDRILCDKISISSEIPSYSDEFIPPEDKISENFKKYKKIKGES